MVEKPTDAATPKGVWGFRGLVIGVLGLVAIVVVAGGHGFLSGATTTSAAQRTLAPFPGFPVATHTRLQLGANVGLYPAFAELAQTATTDWQQQFVAAEVPWQDPRNAVDVAPFPAATQRAHLVLLVGTYLGQWVGQLLGLTAQLNLQHMQGKITAPQLAARTRQFAACLAGAWGRSVIDPRELARVAPADVRAWILIGAARGTPRECAPTLRAA